MGHRMTCHTTPKNMVGQGGANTPQKGATPPPPPTGAVGGGGAAHLNREVVGQICCHDTLGSASFFAMTHAATTVAIRWKSGFPAIPSTSKPSAFSKPTLIMKKNEPPKAHIKTNATTALRVAGFLNILITSVRFSTCLTHRIAKRNQLPTPAEAHKQTKGTTQ